MSETRKLIVRDYGRLKSLGWVGFASANWNLPPVPLDSNHQNAVKLLEDNPD